MFCRVVQHNSPADRQQDWPMNKDQQCDANNQTGDHATPKPPVTPRLCLIVLGHAATLLPLCPRAKSKRLVWFPLASFSASRTYLPVTSNLPPEISCTVSARYYLGEEFGSTSALENLASLDQIERTPVRARHSCARRP